MRGIRYGEVESASVKVAIARVTFSLLPKDTSQPISSLNIS
jgi:hypothetical protein